MLVPSKRGLILSAGVVGMTIAVVVVLPDSLTALWALWGLWAVILMLDWALSARPADFVPQAYVPGEFYVDEAADLRVQISRARMRNTQRLDYALEISPSDELLLLDDRGQFELKTANDILTVPLTGCKRGTGQLKALHLRWQAPWGLWQLSHIYPLDQGFRVAPNIQAAKRLALQLQRMGALSGEKAMQDRGQGSEFDSLRDFTFGMDSRLIDWKQSAKHRTLVAKDMRAETNHHIVFAIDNGYLMQAEIDGVSRLDRSINAALAVAYGAAASGDMVGLFAYHARPELYLKPQRGLAGFGALRSRVADIGSHRVETNHTLGLMSLAEAMPRRGLIVLMTDFVDTTTAQLLLENLALMGRKQLIAFVSLRDPVLHATANQAPDSWQSVHEAVVADALLAERRKVFDQLSRFGLLTLDVSADRLTAAVLNTYLRVREREMI